GSAANVALKIAGDVETPLNLSVEQLRAMPHQTVKVTNPHDKKSETYEGVPISDLLARAGVPLGEKLRGPWMAACVVADASDGYRATFALAELDPGFLDSGVIVADKMDGAPLPDGQGPLKLVAPHEKRPARWVRMVNTLTVIKLPRSN